MKLKIAFAFIILLGSCKTAKQVTHPLMREDGFYYREQKKDMYQLMRFYSNGRVTINEVLGKPEFFELYQNRMMCCTDSNEKQFPDLITCSLELKKDSVRFIKSGSFSTVSYNTLYRCKLYRDSVTAEIRAMDVDTTMIKIRNNHPFVTFRFVKAQCDPNQQIPKASNYKWEQKLTPQN